jgi:hypothetical protein
MHDTHVKRKENQMNRYVMEEFHSNPALLERLIKQAHRERAHSIGAGLTSGLATLKRLGRRLLPRFDFRRSHWMERLG